VDTLLVGREGVAAFQRLLHGLACDGKVLEHTPSKVLRDLVEIERVLLDGHAPVVDNVRVDGCFAHDLIGWDEHRVEEHATLE